MITVFINGVPTEMPRGTAIDMKTMFGEDVILVHSSGVSVPTNEFGFLMQTLQHGESYYLVVITYHSFNIFFRLIISVIFKIFFRLELFVTYFIENYLYKHLKKAKLGRKISNEKNKSPINFLVTKFSDEIKE